MNSIRKGGEPLKGKERKKNKRSRERERTILGEIGRVGRERIEGG